MKVRDKESQGVLKFYTTEKLGDKQSLTPEGFLVILDVPVARTGTMKYGPNEIDAPVGKDGLITVYRTPEEVFSPENIASYHGKPVVNDHPPIEAGDVRPENWKEFTVGVVLNPRRGTGMQGDLMIADFTIYDPDAIADIQAGKREVSCGYDAEYEVIAPGELNQKSMIGNHIALVDAGRCGTRCAIGDKKLTIEGKDMAATAKKWSDGLIGRLLKAFHDKDENEFKEALKDAEKEGEADPDKEGGGVHVHVGGGDDKTMQDHEERIGALEESHKKMTDSMAAMQDAFAAFGKTNTGDAETEEEKAAKKETADDLEAEAPTSVGDKARTARDSAFLEESFQETIAAAEILVPGIRIPTYDRALEPKKTLDTICGLRRSALDAAYTTAAGREMIEAVHGKPLDMTGMRCQAVRSLFRAVVAVKKAANSAGQAHDNATDKDKDNGSGIKSLSDLIAFQKANYPQK